MADPEDDRDGPPGDDGPDEFDAGSRSGDDEGPDESDVPGDDDRNGEDERDGAAAPGSGPGDGGEDDHDGDGSEEDPEGKDVDEPDDGDADGPDGEDVEVSIGDDDGTDEDETFGGGADPGEDPFDAGPDAGPDGYSVDEEDVRAGRDRDWADEDGVRSELDRLWEELEGLEDHVEGRTVSRSAFEAEMRRYVRWRVRKGHVTGWGPYVVLLYGTGMTLGAFLYLESYWAILAMIVVWLSTLGLYVLMVLLGICIGALRYAFKYSEKLRSLRSEAA